MSDFRDMRRKRQLLSEEDSTFAPRDLANVILGICLVIYELGAVAMTGLFLYFFSTNTSGLFSL